MKNEETIENLSLEQQKQQFEASIMHELYERYPVDQRSELASIMGIHIISCGPEPTPEQLQPILNGLKKIENTFGKNAENTFSGLSVFMVNGFVPGGGQALGREDAVIVNTAKTTLTLTEMEEMLDKTGEYRKGDRSSLVENSDEISATELDIVHELGHILEFRTYGDYDKGFESLNQEESPTEYGQKSAREDYAESWMYLVFDGMLDEKRQLILQDDLQAAARS